MIFEPSLLIQKSFFSHKKRWIRKSVKIHLLVYKSTFKNTRTSCSPSQNFLHFTLQKCDFPDFWAIPFDTEVIFFTKEKMNSKICQDTLVGMPEYLQRHQDVLLTIAELPTFYIAKVRFSQFLSHPFWYKSHFFTKEKMNSKICHDTLVGMPEYLQRHQDVLLTIAELPTFYIAKLRFSRFLSNRFWYKSHFSTKEKMNSKICQDTLAGIPEYLQKHQDVLLSIAELPTFYIAKLRFSRFLSHPFWYKIHFFHKRKDEFEHLSRYTCWHTRVPSQTPGRVALHRRTSYVLHCKSAIFPIFEPSLLVQKSFFSQKKRWIRKSVTIHLLACQSTFNDTRTSCSQSQNFLHFTLQSCDFPDFWAIPFDTKVIFFTQKKMNSKICQDTLAGIPEYLQKHQDVLLSIAELPTFYIAKLRFSRFLSHPFWYKIHFFHKRKDEFEHLSRYTCWHTRVPSQTPGRVALHRRTSYVLHCKSAIFPIFEPSLLVQKSFFSQKKRWIRKSVTIHLLAYQSTFKNTRDVLLSIAELPTFYIAKRRFSWFLSHPFWYKSHFFHTKKDEFENLSRYTCWYTRVPSKTPGRLALHRRTSYILHCKSAIFQIFEPSLLIQKSYFSQKKRWIRKSVTIHLLACQSTFKDTRTSCSQSQNFQHFTLQRCDFPMIFEPSLLIQKSFFSHKEKMNSKICQDTLVGIQEYLQKHQDVLLSIAELPTFYIAKSAIFQIFEPSLLIQKSYFSQKKRWIRKSVTIHLLACQSTFKDTRTSCSQSQNFQHFTLQRCDFPNFWAIPFDTKVIFSQKKRWIRKSVTIHLLACQSTFNDTRTSCSQSQNFLHFTLQRCDFPDFWEIPFDTKAIFFTKEMMNSKICHDTLVGIPENLHKHQDVLLSIAELPTIYIAKRRFSRFLSHPFWHKSHFFHKRKDEFQNLPRYSCWHTRVPSKTPGRLALHRRTSYILHCKCAIFQIFEPSLLIQKPFFSQKKRWIRTSVTIHLLAYQSTFKNTRTSCSQSQNFQHFTLQRCDFPNFWAIPFDTKVIFSQKKRWIRTSVTIHLLAYQSTFKNTRTSCSPSQNFLHFTLQSCDFPDFWAIPFDTKVIFFTKEKMNSRICHDTLVGIPEYLQKHQDVLLSIAELPTFYIANVRFSRFLSHPFWYKSHFFHKRKDEFEHLSRYTCWHTRVPSKTPGRLAPNRRTSNILHCKGAIFPIFEPSLLIQKSFFDKRKDEFENLSRYTCWHTRVPS